MQWQRPLWPLQSSLCNDHVKDYDDHDKEYEDHDKDYDDHDEDYNDHDEDDPIPRIMRADSFLCTLMLKVCPYKCKKSSNLNFRGKLKVVNSAYLIINIV